MVPKKKFKIVCGFIQLRSGLLLICVEAIPKQSFGS